MRNILKKYRKDKDGDIEEQWVFSRLIILSVIVAIIVLSMLQSFTTVQAGTRGVLLTLGKPTAILEEGLSFKAPWITSVEILPINTRALSSSESTGTSEQLDVITSVTINYRLDPKYVDYIWTQLGRDYETRIVKPFMQESLKQTTARFSAESFLKQRDQLSSMFFQILKDKLEPYHIQLITVSITNYQYPKEYDDRITAKLTEEQRAIEAENILKRIKIEAQQQVIQAQAKANATIATATAEAQSQLILAKAQAEAIRLLQTQLANNPEYLEYVKIKQWDGKLPYFFGGDVMPFLNINATKPSR